MIVAYSISPNIYCTSGRFGLHLDAKRSMYRLESELDLRSLLGIATIPSIPMISKPVWLKESLYPHGSGTEITYFLAWKSTNPDSIRVGYGPLLADIGWTLREN